MAKYFAIIPALFAGTLPWLKEIDIMHLHSPTSAILSAIIFNALIIPALIPIALKGVKYRPIGADALLRQNLLIWGLGGVILPFIGNQTDRRDHGGDAPGILRSDTNMGTIFGKSLLLLVVSLVICCVIYPAVLWAIGQTAFPFQADGSMVKDSGGNVVGSLLIGQGFTKDEYFQPRPSATATPYDASASGPSALAASNYALRGRVAAAIGPIATYKDGRTVGPDIEKWFQQDRYQGKPSIVAQWADLHQGFNGSNGMAQGWVSADPTHAQYVSDWAKAHPAIVAQWVKDNPGTPNPQATDLAVVFFENFSKDNPGKFLSAAPAPATAPATAASATACSARDGDCAGRCGHPVHVF